MTNDVRGIWALLRTTNLIKAWYLYRAGYPLEPSLLSVAIDTDVQVLAKVLSSIPISDAISSLPTRENLNLGMPVLSALPIWMRKSIAAIRVLVATMHDSGQETISELYETLRDQIDHGSAEHRITAFCLGFAAWSQGSITAAREAFTHADRACQHIGDQAGEGLATCFLAEVSFQEGFLARSAQLYNRASLLLNPSDDLSYPSASLPAIGLGTVYYEWNDLARARQYIDQGLDLAIRGGRVDVILAGLIVRARLQQAMGDPTGACMTMEQAVAHAYKARTPRLIAYIEAQQADLWFVRGATLLPRPHAARNDISCGRTTTESARTGYSTLYRRGHAESANCAIPLHDGRHGQMVHCRDIHKTGCA